MRTPFVNLAAVAEPLHELLEELLAGTKCSKRMRNNRMLQEEDWTAERGAAWMAAKNVLQNAMTLAYTKEGWKTPIFLDPSDLYWR